MTRTWNWDGKEDMLSIQLQFLPSVLEDEQGSVDQAIPGNDPVSMGFD